MSDIRHPQLLNRDTAALLIVDIQPRLSRLIPAREQVIATALRLIRLADIYGLPVGLTEQNRERFGPTEAPLLTALEGKTVAEPLNKLEFSACAAGASRELTLRQLNRQQIILVGVETHICILQTALDLLHAGRQVHVVTDGTASRAEFTHENGLARLAAAGCILTNWESVCYEIAFAAGDDRFRRMLEEIMKAQIIVPPVESPAAATG